MSIIPIVIQQHAEEAAILWLRRDHAVGEPHYSLADLAKLDDQLEAHSDGLRVADANGTGTAWEVCQRELEWGEPGEVFPAAILAYETGEPTRVQHVLESATDSYDNSRSLVSALGWFPYDKVAAYIDQLRSSDVAAHRRIGIAASVAHGQDPGAPLADALEDADDCLRARALRAVGELGRFNLLPAVHSQLAATPARCQFSAAWSVARLDGEAHTVAVLQQLVQQGAPDAESALQMVLRRVPPETAKTWIGQLLQDQQTARLAVMGMGVTGLPDFVPELLDIMQTAELARVAGEAFSMITGVDLAYQDLESDWPEGFSAGPTEDPDDEIVTMDPDENLPWPNRAAVADWWVKHRDDFKAGTRYLLGRPLDDEPWLEEVLSTGYQRQRAAAALELAIRHPQKPLFNVRAPARRQQRLLGLK